VITLYRATCVAIGGRAVLIEGPPGSGKSTLALALIDRGAVLVGDDGVELTRRADRLFASPPPNIAGLLEVRNLGIFPFPVAANVPVALALRFDSQAPRFIDEAESIAVADLPLPLVRLWPDSPVAAIKAELAMQRYGLT
jgi:serine kinase of HPr protein (carbohydrate metabolism regulator)